MAGDVPGLDLDVTEVEAGLRAAMQFGLAVDDNGQAVYPVFVLAPPPNSDPTFADVHRVPWSPTEHMVLDEDTVQDALCAVEAGSVTEQVSPGGVSAQRATVTVTLLMEEWQRVRGCVAVRIGGVRYERWQTPAPLALGQIGVQQIIFRAEDV